MEVVKLKSCKALIVLGKAIRIPFTNYKNGNGKEKKE